MIEFLVDGHIREYYDTRELETSTWDWIRIIKKEIGECEKLGLDYDSYIDKECLRSVVLELECVLDHKDSKHIKRRDYEV